VLHVVRSKRSCAARPGAHSPLGAAPRCPTREVPVSFFVGDGGPIQPRSIVVPRPARSAYKGARSRFTPASTLSRATSSAVLSARAEIATLTQKRRHRRRQVVRRTANSPPRGRLFRSAWIEGSRPSSVARSARPRAARRAIREVSYPKARLRAWYPSSLVRDWPSRRGRWSTAAHSSHPNTAPSLRRAEAVTTLAGSTRSLICAAAPPVCARHREAAGPVPAAGIGGSDERWCPDVHEPGAGSDWASLRYTRSATVTSARPRQKVLSHVGARADFACSLRVLYPDPERHGHSRTSLVSTAPPGVEVRPAATPSTSAARSTSTSVPGSGLLPDGHRVGEGPRRPGGRGAPLGEAADVSGERIGGVPATAGRWRRHVSRARQPARRRDDRPSGRALRSSARNVRSWTNDPGARPAACRPSAVARGARSARCTRGS